MRIKLGEIPYLNCAPFYWDRSWPDSSSAVEWVSLPPRELGRLARRGEIDAGPLSLIDAFALEDRFEPLGNFVISTPREAKSVLLFSKRPPAQLDHRPIGLTEESSTSTRLLDVLLRYRYRAHPRFELGFRPTDEARLLIGNAALDAQAGGLQKDFPLVYDLGKEWSDWKDLPFVFARWMARKSLKPADKQALADFVRRNLEGCAPDFANALAAFEARSGRGFPGGAEYLSAFRYRAGAEELKAIAAFRTLVEARSHPGRPQEPLRPRYQSLSSKE